MSTKPSRIMNRVSNKIHREISIVIQSAVGEALEAIGATAQECCYDCIYINKETNYCRKWHTTPPLKVLCKGCEAFEEDIPF
jgi:hypothetical protein